MNLRKRLGFCFGGGGGGGGEGGGAVASETEGAFGRMGPSSRCLVEGIDVGGAVCTFPPGGCGGTKGILWGGTTESDVGVAGDAAVADVGSIGPGAGGVGPFAV